MTAVQVEKLRKVFGDVVAVRDLSFTIHHGEIYGLLGPNGAGKTTTFSIVAGIIPATAGTVRIHDEIHSPDRTDLKQLIGIVPQDITLFDELTPLENLVYFGGLYGMNARTARERAYELLDWMELLEKARTPVKKLSGGMKRRVNFLAGIVHEPEILLLDEPTVGIDVQTRMMILERTRELAKNGMAILYTTHYMEEAEKLCDRIGIIDHGRLLVEGPLHELHGKLEYPIMVEITGEFDASNVDSFFGAWSVPHQIVLQQNGRLVVGLKDSRQAVELIDELGRQMPIHNVAIRPPSLENLFIELTGRELRE